MQSFTFHTPTEVVFGKGAEDRTAEYIRKYGGTRVLLLYGGQSAQKSGLLGRVEQNLADAGLRCRTLGGVRPNPRLSFAQRAAEEARAFSADFILAVGGGSVIDTAKAAAHGAANPDTPLWDFWSLKTPVTRSLPVGAVLTIAAAGSETSNSSVLTNDETGQKRGLSTEYNRPRFAVMDPELTMTLPPYQAACGAVDILMHTLDRYFTPTTGNELTDELAEALLRVAVRNGAAAMNEPRSVQAMSELMWCGSLSHNGLTGLGAQTDFAVHQLGHELSAMFDLAHGASLSAVWGDWARYVCGENPARFARYGERVWNILGGSEESRAEAAIERTVRFFASLGMPTCFSQAPQVGVVSEAELDELAERCTYGRTRTIGSFRVLELGDIRRIYAAANR